MGEPIMPEKGFVIDDSGEDGIGTCVQVFTLPRLTPVVVVPTDPASWQAMVERAAKGLCEKDGRSWGFQTPEWQGWYGHLATSAFRAALGLPDGWTP